MDKLANTLHKLVDDRDWHNLSALSTALMTGEWDSMSERENAEWLDELEGV